MHSAEPFESAVANPLPPVPPSASDAEAWRAEVASRVQGYRARQTSRRAEQQSLDFSPEHANSGARDGATEQQGVGVEAGQENSPAEQNETTAPSAGAVASRQRLPCRRPSEPQGACDTNYYRRLNAHALEQSAQTSAATAPRVAEDAIERVEAARPLDTPRELPLDLQLHAPSAGDPCLDRYRIHDAAEPDACAAAAALPTAEPQLAQVALPQPSPLTSAPAPAASAGHGSLRVFPRPLLEPPLWAPPSRDELADPVSRPRILEVPEDIMPAVQGSLFPAIRLDAEEPEPSARRQPEIEIPLPVAPLPARLKAGLIDLAVVGAGAGIFAAITAHAMPELAAKTFSIMIAVAGVLLWAAYQQMFLLYAGRTAGMRLAGIRLITFDGRTPRWSERRSRARCILLSCASAALGFLWALLDEDALCWHDRVSQTFPTLR